MKNIRDNLLRRHFFLSMLIGLTLLGASPQCFAQWHHRGSPFRLVLKVQKTGNHPQAGILLELPICGLADASGRDVFIFDEGGQPLACRSLGAGMQNQTLVLAEEQAPGKRIYAYFGSAQPAPQNKAAFLQPLICEVRKFAGGELNDYRDAVKAWEKGETQGKLHLPSINLAYNPVSSDDAFLARFTGWLNVEASSRQTFMIVCDDAGYLEIDGRLLIDYSGRHSAHESRRGEQRTAIDLDAGVHPVKMLLAEFGGGQMAVLASYHDERSKALLPPSAYVRPGTADIENVESRTGNAPPIFSGRAKAYIGYADTVYTLMQLQTSADEFSAPPAWRFGDGGGVKGRTVEHVFVGTAPQAVAVEANRIQASGRVEFPENAPPRWFIRNNAHFNQFAKIMLSQEPDDLDTATLLGYRRFFEYREYNPQLEQICRALRKRELQNPAAEVATTVQLARVLAGKAPEESLQLYQAALNAFAKTNKSMPTWGAEALELAVFADKSKHAQALRGWLIEKFSMQTSSFSYLATYEALLAGDYEKYDDLLYRLVHQRENIREHRKSSVRRNALEEKFEDLLAAGFISDAAENLREWELISPEDHFSGALELGRANLMFACGQPEHALMLLDKTVQRNPVIARLPEIDWLRYRIHKRLDHQDAAEKIRARILRDYPNHPTALALGRE